MNNLKGIFKNINGKNKSLLSDVYASRDDDDQIYQYEDLKFYFTCPSMRTIEASIMYNSNN